MKRPWNPEQGLELLEQAHQEFERRMGPGLDTVIEVEDRISESHYYGARAEISKQIHSPSLAPFLLQKNTPFTILFLCHDSNRHRGSVFMRMGKTHKLRLQLHLYLKEV